MALFGSSEPKLAPGATAPGFTLPDQDGKLVSLADFAGRKVVVLYFYPKDETPGCTKESCAFRDAYEELKDAGAEVIGVSSDSPESHKRFAARHRLPFTLLSDAKGTLRKAYGVPATLGLLPGRVSFVIDREGVVRHVFNSQFDPTRHVREAKDAIARLG
jgi:peroxiredoxin Q/BCP